MNTYGVPYLFLLSDDLERDCNHMHVNGCVTDLGIITLNPFNYADKGCDTLTHELYHIYGYEEHEIPKCVQNQEFRK